MGMDDYNEMPYGCMECASIIPHLENPYNRACPRCGSTEVYEMDVLLQKLIEYDTFMQEVGLDRMSEYD